MFKSRGMCFVVPGNEEALTVLLVVHYMRSIGSHFDEGVHMVFWTLGTSFISKMGLFFSAFPNLKM